MLIMESFSAALYLAHPEVNRAQGVSLLTAPSTSSRVNFVNVDRFIYQEFDHLFLLVFHETIVQTSVHIM
jgi:hypothetical protein